MRAVCGKKDICRSRGLFSVAAPRLDSGGSAEVPRREQSPAEPPRLGAETQTTQPSPPS